jgi:hypothetical protein
MIKDIEKEIADIEKEKLAIEKQMIPLEKKRTQLYNKLKKLRNDLSKKYISTLPQNIEDFSDEQLEWLLYHWRDETESDFDFKYKLFNKIGCFTVGINGHELANTIRQSKFLARSYFFTGFIKLYKISKHLLKDFPSRVENDKNIIELDMHQAPVIGWDREYDEIRMEIDKSTDLCRFINKDRYNSKIEKWITFDEAQEILLKIED